MTDGLWKRTVSMAAGEKSRRDPGVPWRVPDNPAHHLLPESIQQGQCYVLIDTAQTRDGLIVGYVALASMLHVGANLKSLHYIHTSIDRYVQLNVGAIIDKIR